MKIIFFTWHISIRSSRNSRGQQSSIKTPHVNIPSEEATILIAIP